MKFSYNWLNSFFKEDLPAPEILAEKLMMHFFEVEKVEKMGDDHLLDIDILPNRAYDCFCHIGVAREIGAIFDFQIELPDIKIKRNSRKSEDFVNFKIKDKEICSRYTLRIIEGVSVEKKTPKYIKKRLKVCGLQSVNNIVDITNYVMLETGQPLHAFDGEKINGNEIEIRRAKKGEKIETLDGKNYDLDKTMPIIADKKGPIGIAGIKGGSGPEVDESTNLLFIEAANFDPKTIRKASKKLKLRTDASSRFEHGIDPELTVKASDRAVSLIQKHAGGKEAKDFPDSYSKRNEKKVLNLSVEKTNSLLGTSLKITEIESILKRLNFKVERGNDIKVRVPIFRNDIEIEEDLIEEVGRIHGYENIESKSPKVTITSPEINSELFWEDKVREILKEHGYAESYNYSFINEKLKKIFNLDHPVEMENPVSKEHKYLRPTLFPRLLENINKNKDLENSLRIFEIGKIFKGKDKEEKKKLSAVRNDADFRTLKGDIDCVLEGLGIGKVQYTAMNKDDDLWTFEAASVKLKDSYIGKVGKISPQILEKLKIEEEVFAFELDMDKLIQAASDKSQYKKISKFPAAIKDISVLVPENLNYEEFVSVVENAGGELLVDVDLFDLYQGEKISKKKKNFGVRLFFQAEDRTLSKEEINKLLKKIISTVEEKSGWEVRKK